MTILFRRLAMIAVILTAAAAAGQKGKATAPAAPAAQPPLKVAVDASHAPDKILHSTLQIPVRPGPQKFFYPKWIPGAHGPTGPIVDLTGLQFYARGQRVTWRRNLSDMYTFELTVPEGTTTLEARLDLVMPAPPQGFSSGASATTQLAVISWNQVVLYPDGRSTDEIQITPSLKLPSGWHYDTALTMTGESGDTANFQTVSLTKLVDSPVLAGAHFRRIPLTPEGPIQHYVDAASDSESALQIPQETINNYKRLVAETGALFGARHYQEYHFLLTLSDHTAHFGLEHHESSDDRVSERTMVDDDMRMLAASLLPHEMTHSWNGKYRRPAGLATPDFQKPMEGDLLWVYEGLTQYWGDVLAARSGLWTPQQFLDEAAETAAALNNTPGRVWRPLQDTADAAQLLYGAAPEFETWRRGVDFYPEGFLIWLDVDTQIRQLSNGHKSLNDFSRAFHGGQSTPPKVVTYTFDNVVSALNDVAPYDWKKFLRDRLDTYGPGAPLGGITNGGWKLVYTEERSAFTKTMEDVRKFVDARFSVGLALDDKGGIHDVLANSPAWNARIAPGSTLVAVNGRKFSGTVLRDALKAGKDKGPKIELLVESGDFYRTYVLDYHGGERYAHLLRDETKPDVLSEIIKPLAK